MCIGVRANRKSGTQDTAMHGVKVRRFPYMVADAAGRVKTVLDR